MTTDDEITGDCGKSCFDERWAHDVTDIPEPVDGARIEFEYYTDVYGAWGDSTSSIQAGWPAERRWVTYPGTVPHTWACMQRQFGEALRSARRMVFVGDETLADVIHVHGSEVEHHYWSTHCRHGNHDACSATSISGAMPGALGHYAAIERTPAQCKTCAAPCVCPCHKEVTE